jgi:hypothetical protein
VIDDVIVVVQSSNVTVVPQDSLSVTATINVIPSSTIEINPSSEIEVATVGTQGLPGAKGESVGHLVGICDIDLGGHRVLEVTSSGTLTYATSPIGAVGISLEASSSGSPINYAQTGYIEESSWNWTPGKPIYQVGLGLLTQVVPTSSFIKQVGIALSAKSMEVQMNPAIIIGD